MTFCLQDRRTTTVLKRRRGIPHTSYIDSKSLDQPHTGIFALLCENQKEGGFWYMYLYRLDYVGNVGNLGLYNFLNDLLGDWLGSRRSLDDLIIVHLRSFRSLWLDSCHEILLFLLGNLLLCGFCLGLCYS